MSSKYVLWFNPRCSTCRHALDILQQRGIEPELRRYLETPPTIPEVRDVLRKLGQAAHQILRTKEDECQALRLSDRTPEDELVQQMSAHPILIERPILIAGDRAIVARPAERVLELLD